MIDHAGARGLTTHLSTNLNTLTEEQMQSLLRSRLDQLVVSCDGVDQESYSRYKVGGSFDLVMQNLRRLLARRRGRKPFIVWQYLVMKHNQAHLARARELAAQIGVDLIQFAPINLCDTPFVGVVDRALAEEWLPSDPAIRPDYDGDFLSPSRCPYLWRMAFFSHDGSVNPCCDVYEQRHAFGKVDGDHPLAGVWNNPRFVSARSLFTDAAAVRERTICSGCRQFTPKAERDQRGAS
jgi:MoaA/NifB/PqqE/SkfB family radical SAM enzyme